MMRFFVSALFGLLLIVGFSGCAGSMQDVYVKTKNYIKEKQKEKEEKERQEKERQEKLKREKEAKLKLLRESKPIVKGINKVIYTKKVILNVLKKSNTISFKPYLTKVLITLNILDKKTNKLKNMDEVFKNQTFDSITHTKDNLIAYTKHLKINNEESSFIIYFTKNHQFEKLVLVGSNKGELTLSLDGNYVFAHKSHEVIDTNTLKRVQKFSWADFKVNAGYKLGGIKFSNDDKYISTVVYGNSIVVSVIKINNKKVLLKRETSSSKYVHRMFEFSPNSKYIVNRFGDKDTFAIYPINGGSYIKSFGDNINPRYTTFAWNNDKMFYNYYDDKEDKIHSGIYDTKTDEIYCKDIFTKRTQQLIIWNKDNNYIYLISHDSVRPIVFENNKCIVMEPYFHNIEKQFDDENIINHFVQEKNKLIVYSKEKNKTVIATIKLKTYSKEHIDALKKLLKIKKLREAGFDEKAAEKLKQLIVYNKYDIYANDFAALMNNGFDYSQMYAFAFQRYKRQHKDSNIDWLFGAIQNYITLESQEGLSKNIKAMIKEYKKIIGKKPTNSQKQRLAIYEAIYLLEIGKDKEAYDKLFDVAPFSKSNINFIIDYSGFTKNRCALYKDIKKLSVITEIDESKFSKGKYKQNKEVFGYDIYGNKVFAKKIKK